MINDLKEVAKEAGELLKEGFFSNKELSFKGKVDLVTDYDVAVEEKAFSLLKSAFPEHTLIGEESESESIHALKAIYVDPIDGTTNFVHGIPMCALSIGIWEGGRPKAGVVYNPVLGELYSAEEDKGAFLNDQKIHVSEESAFINSLIATGFPYTKVEQGEDYRWVVEKLSNLLPKTRDIRRLGAASVDLCFVARGTLQAYYEINLKPWDIAAGIAILKEAGGVAWGEHGDSGRIDDKLVIAGNERIVKNLYEVLCVN